MKKQTMSVMYEGSAKTVWGNAGDSEIVFEFSDRYSLFDWGKMPDTIPGKGIANTTFTTLFYTMFSDPKVWRGWTIPCGILDSVNDHYLSSLKNSGLKTHLIAKDDEAENRIRVKAVDVKYPKHSGEENGNWDYFQYKNRIIDSLVPLEVIFRFEIVEGSSLLSRATDTSYLEDLSLGKIPEVGDIYARPIIEFSTKLEEKDRFLSYAEAKEISGMSATEFEKLYYNVFWTALLLKSSFNEAGVNLVDGKFEFAFIDSNTGIGDRDFMLVDSIGPDELRLTASGHSLSKEFLREFYRGSTWYNAIIESKEVARSRGSIHWKDICIKELGQTPEHLSEHVRGEASNIYCWLKDKLEECFVSNLSIVILGKGGREHAIAKKMVESRLVTSVTVIPGNRGMCRYDEITVAPEISESDHQAIVSMVEDINPAFVFVGPESLLEANIVEMIEAKGIKCIGPGKQAAKLETSKSYAKNIMKKYGIPTADFVLGFGHDDSIKKLEEFDCSNGVVVKCDELAAGKGVVVASDIVEAKEAIYNFSKNSNCPVKSQNFVIEEKLEGEEISFFVLCDGENYVRIGAAHDYKRAIEGDQGPNTGGMGGFSAKIDCSEELYCRIESEVVEPLLGGMIKEGSPFKGVLFVGLMVKDDNLSVLEFNVRFGDPEAQILLPLIENDFAKICLDTVNGNLSKQKIILSEKRAVHVVLASRGYPDTLGCGMDLGKKLNIGEITLDEVDIFFAGVDLSKNDLVNSGGRVVGITAVADTLSDAKSYAYEMMEKIKLEGGFYRRDIAAGERI